jgi:SNF2 family DNA or RNA helicase
LAQLNADDVGVGKTIEALLIAKELYERKEIKCFAIVCLPHLCDQWQDELKNKFVSQSATPLVTLWKASAIYSRFPVLSPAIEILPSAVI